MRGTIRVVRPEAPADTQEAVAAKQAAQINAAIAALKLLDTQKPASNKIVWVGAGVRRGPEITSFYPSTLTINPGDTVSFVNHDQADIHTVTFGPPAYTTKIENTFVEPGRVPLFNPLGALPRPAGCAPRLRRLKPRQRLRRRRHPHRSRHQPPRRSARWNVKFTKTGTYHFECVIHEHMDGTIKVITIK